MAVIDTELTHRKILFGYSTHHNKTFFTVSKVRVYVCFVHKKANGGDWRIKKLYGYLSVILSCVRALLVNVGQSDLKMCRQNAFPRTIERFNSARSRNKDAGKGGASGCRKSPFWQEQKKEKKEKKEEKKKKKKRRRKKRRKKGGFFNGCFIPSP